MSGFYSGEKISIKNSNTSFKRYGSTCNHVKRQDYFINHDVTKTDTLQGLALKYNTTTEHIRRENRLFASDSLFLRSVLKIPVTKEVADSMSNGSRGDSSHNSSSGSGSGSTSDSATATSSISTEDCSDDDDKSACDFLSKIDSSIASTKAQVETVQQNSHFVDPTDPTMMRRSHNKRQMSAPTESLSTSEVPQPVVLSHGRQVRNSLQRLEQEKDALFEL